jgi:hypothetical protein
MDIRNSDDDAIRERGVNILAFKYRCQCGHTMNVGKGMPDTIKLWCHTCNDYTYRTKIEGQ